MNFKQGGIMKRTFFRSWVYILSCLTLIVLSDKPTLAKQHAGKLVQDTPAKQRLAWFARYQEMKKMSPFKILKWKFIGPDIISGRVTDVEVHPGNGHVMYVGAATGGLWKTDNCGTTWEPIMDDVASVSIGDIAISPSNPDLVWVGTGEANIFRASVAGIGVFKSVDGGKKWEHMGLEETHTIGRIIIHPSNPDIVYVAASGNEWTPNSDRGVFRTQDGGKSWEKIFYIDQLTGAIDLSMDPGDPNTLYVSMWNRIRRRWSDPVPGPNDGLFKTIDGGKNWTAMRNGLPDHHLAGRMGIDIARSNPRVLYVLVDNHEPGRKLRPGERDSYGRVLEKPQIKGAEVYRSENGGETFAKVSPADSIMSGLFGTYGWVFGQIRVDPMDENTVFIMGVELAKSVDGGKHFRIIDYPGLHADHHAMWIDPRDSKHILNGNDGGINLSYDGGETWQNFRTIHPVVQFYNITYDMEKPFNIYGSVQDHGTYRGNIDYKPELPNAFDRPKTPWTSVPGGEGCYCAVDPIDADIFYSASFYGRIIRTDFSKNPAETVNILPAIKSGEPELRGQWLAPFIISPHNNRIIYHCMQYVFRSLDRGDTWERISPDLTYDNPAEQGIPPAKISFATISTISESPLKFGLLYAGTDDGRLWCSKNHGENWTEITGGLPYKKHVSRVVASTYNLGTVYVTLNGRRDDDFNPYVYRSVDFGRHWVDISANIPGGPVNVIQEDPRKEQILYVGNDFGVYVTLDRGKSWNALSNGLPTCLAWDLFVHPRDNILVLATNGRGVWSLGSVALIQRRVK
jgi:photosystem II stability/assembly factor-like uncharacterized protein